MDRYYTVGKLALRLVVPEHAIRGLANKNAIPHVRAGAYRVFAEKDIPAIRAALVAAGYTPAEHREAIGA